MKKDKNVNVNVKVKEIVDYNKQVNKPSINGVVLIGNRTLEELGIVNDKYYVHEQGLASNEWHIEHNLNKQM